MLELILSVKLFKDLTKTQLITQELSQITLETTLVTSPEWALISLDPSLSPLVLAL